VGCRNGLKKWKNSKKVKWVVRINKITSYFPGGGGVKKKGERGRDRKKAKEPCHINGQTMGVKTLFWN